jgi:uncharacterized membrane protein
MVETSRPPRVTGVDAARAVALLTMALAHMHATTLPGGGATPIGLVVAGRASALFAVLAGVGVALSTRWVRDRRDHAGAAAALLVRAAFLAVLGLGLEQLLDSPPAVILAQYGLLFAVAAVLVRLPATACFAAAGAWCALSPVLSHVLRAGMPAEPGAQPDLAMLADPGLLLTTLGLTGYYPVLTWITYLLVGMGIGRLDLRSTRTAARLVVAGTVVVAVAYASSALLRGPGGAGPAGVSDVVAGTQRAGTTPPDDWGWLAVITRHSGTAFDLAHTAGTSMAAIGALILLTGVATRWVSAPTALLAATGSASLTLYTAHILVTGSTGAFGTPWWLGQAAAMLAVGGVLMATRRRGPLEALVGRLSRAARDAVAGPRPGSGSTRHDHERTDPTPNDEARSAT